MTLRPIFPPNLLRLAVFLFAVSFVTAADLPDLVRMKMAAESGDRVAQFEYGRRLSFGNQKEQFDWLLKSANQGYAPAQDAVAEALHLRYIPDPKKKRSAEREAAAWASRAAYQGFASAQARLGQYYDQGVGVRKDPVKAYMWTQIAVQTASISNPVVGNMVYQANRDSLIKRTSTEDILEGQRLAAAFRAENYLGMTPVEADLAFAELKLSAIYKLKGYQSAVLNNVRFGVGETKEIKLDDHSITLTCVGIEEKAARFAIARTTFSTVLRLDR